MYKKTHIGRFFFILCNFIFIHKGKSKVAQDEMQNNFSLENFIEQKCLISEEYNTTSTVNMLFYLNTLVLTLKNFAFHFLINQIKIIFFQKVGSNQCRSYILPSVSWKGIPLKICIPTKLKPMHDKKSKIETPGPECK